MENSEYRVYQLDEKIFCVGNTNPYKLAMFFLRYQEFYESNNPDFKGKHFKILDYIDWYSQKYGNGAFTYPKDFCGFNIPQEIIGKCIKSIPDMNGYDFEMVNLDHYLIDKFNMFDAYIIGIPYYIGDKKPNSILKHEFAHGLYKTCPEYKKSVDKLLNKVPRKAKKQCAKIFETYMYDTAVHADEIQAYFSTGLLPEMRKIEDIDAIIQPFIVNFNKFFKSRYMKANSSTKYSSFTIQPKF